MRKIKFINGDYYHIFNRGVEKRDIFLDKVDLDRFLQSMHEFNTLDPIGSIYAASFRKNNLLRSLASKSERLVDFVCYCLCPNHYHFILQQVKDKGIEKFMHRLGSGYTNYFNRKCSRSGSLFQGTFKANHIDSDEYLLYLSAYINLNNRVHQIKNGLFKSSWGEYMQGDKERGFCNRHVVLTQFSDLETYKTFTENALMVAKERKELEKIIKLDQ